MPNRVLQAAQSIKTAGTSTGISQDNIIFGMVLLAFVIFITLKGELSTYMGFFARGASQGPSAVPVSTSPQSVVPSIGSGTPGVSANPLAGLPGIPSFLGGVPFSSIFSMGGAFSPTGGGILGAIGSFFSGQGVTGNAAPVTTPQPGSNPTGGIGSA
jgi:hypothetical protein